jgi:pyruvate,water dikinase
MRACGSSGASTSSDAATSRSPAAPALAALPPDAAPGDLDAAAARIRGLFAAAAVPEEIGGELRGAVKELGDESVAVRSSATAEDLADASFAGQQDT